MIQIPISPVSNQTLKCVLNNQNVQINIYQKNQGVFVDFYVSNKIISAGIIAKNINPLIQAKYTMFNGNIIFFDNFGNQDPDYKEFGKRYILVYLTDSEYNDFFSK